MKQPFTSTFFSRFISIVSCCVLLLSTSVAVYAQTDFMLTFFDPARIYANGDNDGGVPDYRETIYGNQPDSLTRYRWVNNAWAPHYGERIMYNGAGQISSAVYTDLTNTMFVSRLRETKTYNEARRFLTSTIAVWRNGAWQDTLRTTFNYNAQNWVSEQERSHRPAGATDWVRQSSTLYEYENNARDLLAQYTIRNWRNGNYVNFYRGTYQYEEGNTSVSVLSEQEWVAAEGQEGGEWRNIAVTNYTFNEAGEWTTAVTSRRNNAGELTPQSRIINAEWHNYPNRQLSYWIEQDMVNGAWQISETGRIAYANNGGTTTSIGTYANGVLADSTREAVTFNSMGLYTGTRVQRYLAEAWVTTADTVNTLTYNTGNEPTDGSRLTERVTQIYNPTTNQLTNARRVELFYVTTSTEAPLALNNSIEVYPNPSTDVASVRFSLSQPAKVSIQLYDVTGRMVKEIAESNMSSGEHRFSINTGALIQGVYLLRVNSNDQSQVKRVVVAH